MVDDSSVIHSIGAIFSITAQCIPQSRDGRHKEILPTLHGHALAKLSQPRIQIRLIITVQCDAQHRIILCLPDQSIIPGLARREGLTVRPRALHELKTVLQAGLVAGEEETASIFGMGVKLRAVGNAIADHAGHFHRVSVGAGVGFADVGAEGAVVFLDAFVAEIVVELWLRLVRAYRDGGT